MDFGQLGADIALKAAVLEFLQEALILGALLGSHRASLGFELLDAGLGSGQFGLELCDVFLDRHDLGV